MIGATKESINALVNSPIKNYPEMAGASTSAACSSSACDDSDFEVPPPTPVKNFGNRQKIQRRRNNSEEERHYASDDECSSDDDNSGQYHPQRSAKKQDLAKKAKLLKRLKSLGLAPRRHYDDYKPTKKRTLRKPIKKSPVKTEPIEQQEQDPLFPRPKFMQCEFCEKDYLTNFQWKKHMAKHLAARKWSISKAATESSLLIRRVKLDRQRPKIWGMVFGRLSGVM